MKFFFLFILLTNFASAESCNVNLFAKIYRLESNQTLNSKEVIQKSDCSLEVNNKIAQIISNSNGVIASTFIEKEFQGLSINITPRKISLFDINSTLKDQLSNNSNLFFLDTRPMNQGKAITLLEGESVRAVCDNCTSMGEKNIKIEINNPLIGSSKILWFTTKIFAKIKVIKAKRNLSYQEKSLKAEDFYFEDSLTSMPQNVLGNLDNIQYYKPNKTIMEGSIITSMDIQPVNLVSYGTPVKLILKNSNINLSKSAMPARSAQFGDTIEIQTANNKKILGRVIDYNKVVIEL